MKMNFKNENFIDYGNTAVLSTEDSIRVVKAASEGDVNARNTLILSNIGFVISIAKKYENTGLDIEDLIQSGIIGLIIAVDKVDPSKKNKFTTFASFWIKNEITNTIRTSGSSLYLADGYSKKFKKVHKIYNELKENSILSNSLYKTISNLTGIKEKEIIYMLNNNNTYSSLDVPLSNEKDSDTIGSTIKDNNSSTPFEDFENTLLNEDIFYALEKLSPIEQKIIIEKFGLNGKEPKTYTQIGLENGKTRAWANKIGVNACQKLQNFEYLEDYVA